MWRFLIRRLIWAVFLVFAATLATYAIFFLIPGDPVTAAAGRGASPAAIDADRRLLQRVFRPVRRLRRRRAVGVSPAAAVDRVQRSLRGALCAADAHAVDGCAERGLRAHGAREGPLGAPRRLPPRGPELHAP